MALRAVSGDATALACSDLIRADTLKRIAGAVASGLPFVAGGGQRVEFPRQDDAPPRYPSADPLRFSEERRAALLQRIDERARKEPRVLNVMARLDMEHAAVMVCRGDGAVHCDIRPLASIRIAAILKDGAKVEVGGASRGLRGPFEDCCADADADALVDEALRQAAVKLEARPALGGMLPVVLGNGWAGVLLHEAVGHGLEGDHTRKGQSRVLGPRRRAGRARRPSPWSTTAPCRTAAAQSAATTRACPRPATS